MKTGKHSLNRAYTGIIIMQIILTAAFILQPGCYTDKKTSTAIIEMVVVFKPEIPVEKATSILYEKDYIFNAGMDNSRGKKYNQETGPKFIVQVPREKIDLFSREMKTIPQVYEVYRADWTVDRD